MTDAEQLAVWREELKNEIREYGRKCVRGYAAGKNRIEVAPTWTNIERLLDSVTGVDVPQIAG